MSAVSDRECSFYRVTENGTFIAQNSRTRRDMP